MANPYLVKKIFFVLMISLSLFVMPAYTQVLTETKPSPELPLNSLRMTNRAQCAVDADIPTDSIFVVVDGYNAGKLSYNLAKSVGMDPSATSLRGMKEFRVAVTRMMTIIINRILSGSLPLLPLNLKTSKLSTYNTLIGACGKKTYCPELNDYLAKIWQNSQGAGIPWEKIDNFTNANFIKLKKRDRLACFYVKKFSALQGHLHETDVDQANLQEMAQTFLEKDKFITHCESPDDTLNSRNSIIQMDLKVPQVDEFSRVGFDFWNSVKIYMSFAWRYTDIALMISPDLGQLFKSIALEESIMLMPNGCKSIEMPACDSETLSLNSLRELAKPDATKADSGKDAPDGPEKDVIYGDPRSVNDDFLGTRSYDDASKWVENFRKNYVQIRGSMKNRTKTALQFLNVLSSAMTASELNEFVKPLAFAQEYTAAHRDELYYFCTEARLAMDQRIDFMKSGIDKLKDLIVMQRISEDSNKSLDEFITYFDNAGAGIIPLCDELEKQNIWNVPNYQINRSGFNSWARELLKISPATGISPIIQPISFGPALLVWDSNQGSHPENVICISAIDCGRKLIKSMVDLYSVAKYADAYMPVHSTVSSSDIFNPYSQLKACKVYDPWFATRRMNKRLFADLANTALFGWNSIPIYIDVDFKPPKVTSLNQLIQNGVVKFDPKLDREKIQASLVADLGPLVGAPCAVTVSPNSDRKFVFYAFNGISMNYCKIKSDGTAIGSPDGSVNSPTPVSRSYCGGCSINFIGVASGVASSMASISGLGFNPIKLGVYLFRTVSRFIRAKKDKVDVPVSREVNLAYVASAYKAHGGIPKKCVKPLGRGEKCE